MIYKDRKTKKMVGLLSYHLKYPSCDNLSVFKGGEFESVFTMLHFKKGHDITVGSVYWMLGTTESRYINNIKQIIQQIKE